MNLVYIMGKIVSDIDFKFTYKSRKNAVAIFICELDNCSLVKIKAFNNNADYCYASLQQGDFAILEGRINSNSEIDVNNIMKL